MSFGKLKEYYNLVKPGIVRGNLLTTAAGFLFACKWHIDWPVFVATLAGISLVIAAACVFNNYIDRGIDAKMARTKKRALVTGSISVSNAMIYAAVLGFAGFGLLLFFVNPLVTLLGLVAMLFYVVFYGIAKRRSPWGTLVGTVPGALPLVGGYVAVTDRINSAALLLFLAMAIWQMPHFYAIAMYRLQDYKAAGLPVWPARHGMRSTKINMLFYIAAYAVVLPFLTVAGYAGVVFAIGMTALNVYWFTKGVQGFRATKDEKWARGMFGVSLLVLLGFSVLLSLGNILP
jgi:protoheme IX farnesyltransferase